MGQYKPVSKIRPASYPNRATANAGHYLGQALVSRQARIGKRGMVTQTNKGNCIMSQHETHWVGIDVSKKQFDVAVMKLSESSDPAVLRKLPAAKFARSPEGVRAFLAWLDFSLGLTGEVRVVMEATGSYSTELCAWLNQQRPDLGPAIINPRHTAHYIKSLGLRSKTDKLDAKALASYGASRRPCAYVPLTPVRAQLRELSRCRADLVSQRTALKNQIGEHPAYHTETVQQLDQGRLDQLNREIAMLEEEIDALTKHQKELSKDYDLLVSLPGVAFVTASVVLAELGDLRRFKKARQLSAFAGLDPMHKDSGQSVHAKPRFCKAGNGRIRPLLYLAALASTRCKGPLQNAYHALLQAGKPPMAAIGAIMRKLLVLMRAVIISGKPYDPHHRSNASSCGETRG